MENEEVSVASENVNEKLKPQKPKDGFAKAVFSDVGVALVLLIAMATLANSLIWAAAKLIYPKVEEITWLSTVISSFSLYIVAIPVSYLVFRRIPRADVPKEKLGVGYFIMFLAAGEGFMLIGNIFSNLLMNAVGSLRGVTPENPLIEGLANSNMAVTVIVMVIAAPIFEELVFRKFIIDRLRPFGFGTAMIVSGLLFGLMHRNLYQFFYAFGVGVILAAVYIKSGRLIYTIIMHMIYNFMNSVVSQLITGGNVLEYLKAYQQGDMNAMMELLPQMMPMIIYGLGMFVIGIGGIGVLCANFRKLKFPAAPRQLPKGTGFSTAILNAGVLVFSSLCVVYMALYIFL